MKYITLTPPLSGAILAALICATGMAHAQSVYRIVGPDGKVTFSDQPPVTAAQGKVVSTGIGASGAAANASLPFELRQVVSKYPVTLYTSAKCAPCDAGRSLLTGRGVPFTERTVSTPQDIEYLQRLSGETSLPFLTIGGQRIKGLSESEWTQYLDAAGYPKTSALPPSFKNAAATPLVPKAEAPVAKPVEKVETPAPAAPPPAVTPANPAGIVF